MNDFESGIKEVLPSNMGEWSGFGIDLLITGVVGIVIYFILFYLLRFWLRNLKSDLPLVTLGILRGPLLWIVIIISLKISFQQLGTTGAILTLQKILTALIIALASYAIAQIFSRIIVYALKNYAEKSEAMWDDVLVPIVESTIPAVIYVVGGFLSFKALGIDLSGILVVFGSAAAVLGLAINPILQNFMSGLVLLVDTPFQFGDVISMPDGSLAVIKKIGLRLTQLYIIDTNCDVYVPNGSLQSQNITNLSRPTSHYYYTLNMSIKSEADPQRAIKLMREVVLAHPDTMGSIDEKLKYIQKYYEWQDQVEEGKELSKREAGRQRLLAEKEVNKRLQKVEETFEELKAEINKLEKGGIDKEEAITVQRKYIEIAKDVGLELVGDRQKKRKRTSLEEAQGMAVKDTLIGAVRSWCKIWLEDPNMIDEDEQVLPQEWERKIYLLKGRMNRLYQKLVNPQGDETRLDDNVETLIRWLNEEFKDYQNEWQEPKIRMEDISGSQTQFVVKYYVDNITLEHCERGYRVNSEVRREMVRKLREAYLYS